MQGETATSGRSVDVVVSTGVELLLGLYALAHARRGDFEIAPAGLPGLDVDAEHADALSLFFGDDYALGTNLCWLAVEQGWHDAGAVVDGVRTTPTADLVVAMTRPPSAPEQLLRRRARAVAAAVTTGTAPAPTVLRSLSDDGFAVDTVREVFARPAEAQQALVRLLDHAAVAFRSLGEQALRDRLVALGATLDEALRSAASTGAGLEAVAGWTLTDADRYRVRLVPSEAIRPVLLSRTVELQEALVVVSGPTAPARDLGELAEALKALGNPQRLAILRDVAHLPATGQDLAELLGLTEATVHHHTSTLRAAGLLTSEREGQRVYHVTDKVRIAGLFDDVLRGVFGA